MTSEQHWIAKGMCQVCQAWSYLLDGEDQTHCGRPLVNVVLRGDEAEQEQHIDRAIERALDEQRELLEDLHRSILALTQRHLPTLVRKYRRTHVVDEYGVVQDIGWSRKLTYFLQKVLLLEDGLPGYSNAMEWVHEVVVEALSVVPAEESVVDVEDLDPVAFEQHCADLLCADGWAARTTQQTGDQGVDVIAERGGLRVVIQCKKYSQSVGNGAVQQVLAGMVYENADFGCVVTNADYTPAARQLASTTGILLLHYTDLPILGQLLESCVRKRGATED